MQTPLGEAGEITVNEALRKGIEVFSPLLDIYKNHPIEVAAKQVFQLAANHTYDV